MVYGTILSKPFHHSTTTVWTTLVWNLRMMPAPVLILDGYDYINQEFPDPTVPNNTMGLFWDDFVGPVTTQPPTKV